MTAAMEARHIREEMGDVIAVMNLFHVVYVVSGQEADLAQVLVEVFNKIQRNSGGNLDATQTKIYGQQTATYVL